MKQSRTNRKAWILPGLVAAMAVFVFDFLFLSDFIAWGAAACHSPNAPNCSLALHLGRWWLAWEVVATLVVAAAIVATGSILARLGAA